MIPLLRCEERGKCVAIESGVLGVHPCSSPIGSTWQIRRIVGLQLPFPEDSRRVTGIFQVVAERLLIGVKDAEVLPVTVVVLTGHEFDTCGSAQRLGVGSGEADPGGCHLVKMRSSVGSAPVASQALDSDIISHDQQDVRALFCHQECARCG